MANIAIMLVAALTSLAGSEWGPEHEGKPEQFIQFTENDVAGSGGCNRFAGGYTFDGTAIKIGPLMSTRMACAEAVMEAEQKWFRMLETTTTADASDAQLVLKDASGAVVGTLRRKDRD